MYIVNKTLKKLNRSEAKLKVDDWQFRQHMERLSYWINSKMQDTVWKFPFLHACQEETQKVAEITEVFDREF